MVESGSFWEGFYAAAWFSHEPSALVILGIGVVLVGYGLRARRRHP